MARAYCWLIYGASFLVMAYLFWRPLAPGRTLPADMTLFDRPDFWPRAVLAALGVTVLIKLILSLRDRQAAETNTARALARLWDARVGGGLLILLLYIFLIEQAGFIASTLLFIALFLLLVRVMDLKALILAPTLITFSLLLFFVRFLYVPLPRGLGVFGQFSDLVYKLILPN